MKTLSNILLLSIDKNYIKNISEAMDSNIDSHKERPYYVELRYSSNYRILVPLRSNCPSNSPYIINLFNDKERKNPGLDFTKMIILTTAEVISFTKPLNVPVNSSVYLDILRKQPQIFALIQKILDDYKIILKKRHSGIDLSKAEKRLLNISTLQNYQDFVMNNGK